jgi:hypothetical protein
MHIVHFAPGLSGLVLPLCGNWGGMDSEWTGEPDGVTCPACRQAMRAAAHPASARAPGRTAPP